MPFLFLLSGLFCSCTFSFVSGSNSEKTTRYDETSTVRFSSENASIRTTSNGGAAPLLISTNDGSQYGAPKKAADTSGTHYASASNAIPEKKMDEASGTVCLTPEGTQKILVIPVIIDDYAINATSANRERIYRTFFGDPSDTSWESLSSYYCKSSFGKLLLQGSVSDWYDCGYSSSGLAALTSSDASYDPTWTVLRGAVAWYKETYHTDATEFDNDGDGHIDGVWLVYSAPDFQSDNSLPKNLFWAYTYWDVRENSSMSSPSACVYCWGSYDFMDTGYGKSGTDAHTFCHETGHMMGLEDYYVSAKVSGTKNYGPMGLIDMMDGNIIDHNAYSKFALGWIDPLVVSGATTLTLKPSSTSGQAVLIPSSNGWNGSAFDEYMLLEYYTPDLLNLSDSENAYPNRCPAFTESGVRIYHVDERLAKATVSGSSVSYAYTDALVHDSSSYTIRAHSNSNAYNVLDENFRAIQAIDCTLKRNFDAECASSGARYHADNSTLFQAGDTFSYAAYQKSFPNYYYDSESTMNEGSAFSYKVAFSMMTSEGITLTISAA